MFYNVTMNFKGFSVVVSAKAETPTGALLFVLGQDWTIKERKDFLGAEVDLL